jgi:hypothetical protein
MRLLQRRLFDVEERRLKLKPRVPVFRKVNSIWPDPERAFEITWASRF